MGFTCSCLDDNVIFSQTEELSHHLQKLLDICVHENLKLKLSECTSNETKINFLGYEVSNGCITPINFNIGAIKKLKLTNIEDYSEFSGLSMCMGKIFLSMLK